MLRPVRPPRCGHIKMRDCNDTRCHPGSVIQPPPTQFGSSTRHTPSPMAICLAPAGQYVVGVARIRDWQMGTSEAVHSDPDLDRGREWHRRQFPNLSPPPNVIGRERQSVVTIEAPTTSSTATGAGHRRARDTPLAKEFPHSCEGNCQGHRTCPNTQTCLHSIA